MSDNRKNVVVVTQHYPPDNSGNASRVYDTTQHLVGEGWDVTVLAPPPSFPHGQFVRSWKRQETIEGDHTTVHRLWAHQPSVEDPSFLSRLAYYILFPLHALIWLLINWKEADVVITSSPPIFTGIAGLPFSLTSTPVLVDMRDLWIDASIGLGFIKEGGIIEKVSRAYQRLVLTCAERVSVTTDELGDQLAARYDISESKFVHLPNGVDADKFNMESGESEDTIIYTGNVGHAQDLEACIEALPYMENKRATLKIVGDGDLRPELESKSESLGIGDRVEFTGLVPREEIPSMLNSCKVGIAPLKDEGTLEYAVPTKAYEYLASGLPVVATGMGELEQLIDKSGGGVLVDNDPEALAVEFDKFVEEDQLRQSIGESGQQYVADRYDREVIAKRMNEILENLS